MGQSASRDNPTLSNGERVEIRNAEDEELQDMDEYDDDYDGDEETEEEWRLRREGPPQGKLDLIKRLLAIAFFAGLGIIVIVVAYTSVPLLTPNPEDITANNGTQSPTSRGIP